MENWRKYAVGFKLKCRMSRPRSRNDAFIGRIKRGIRSIHREWPGKRELRRRRSFGDVKQAVEQVKGEGWQAFAGRHGDWGRDLALLVAREWTGMTLRELGQAVGGLDYGAVSEGLKRMNHRRATDREIKIAFNRTMQILNI
jgi:hypothetical protein